MLNVSKKTLVDVAVFAFSNVALYFAVKYLLSSTINLLDPDSKKKLKAKNKTTKILSRLGVKLDLDLTEYEEVIATEVIHPDDISVQFKDIGGLDDVIDSLQENVIYPLRYPQFAPKGVLLYGPPGCGKTMLAKALAKESGATFINLHVSTLTDKFFGESQKLVHALFSLALKLQPSIIFIDEIDAFLRERKSHDHEAMSMMKSEFMSLWDGLVGSEQTRVLVLGATNRPNDIDKAILRRMPRRFPISLSNADQRKKILTLLLSSMRVHSSFNMDVLVSKTEGYSGSDLKELCRNAVMVPVKESIRKLIDIEKTSKNSSSKKEKEEAGGGGGGEWGSIDDLKVKDLSVRHITLDDFLVNLNVDIYVGKQALNHIADLD